MSTSTTGNFEERHNLARSKDMGHISLSGEGQAYKNIGTTNIYDLPVLATMPVAVQSEAVCLCALTHDVKNFPYVINQTIGISMLAVYLDPYMLKHVTEKTYIICEAAIKAEADSIRFVNPRELSREDYEKLALLAVKYNGMCLQYVPESYQTEEMCDIALDDNPAAIKYAYKMSDRIIDAISDYCG